MMHDLHLSLTISEQEARFGTVRALSLPGGRQVSVSVPAGASDNEELCFPRDAPSAENNEPAGMLILTIHILRADATAPSPTSTVLIPEQQAGVQTLPARHTPAAPMMGASEQTVPTTPTSSPTPAPPAWTPEPGVIPSSPTWGPGPGIAPPPPGLGSAGNWQSQHTPLMPVSPQQGITVITPKIAILLGLALLVILGSSVTFLAVHNAQANANLSATAVVNATATSQVNAQLTTGSDDATAVAQATATTVQATAAVNSANPDPYGQGGTLVVDDKLDGSQSNNWSSATGCTFQGGAYHVQLNEVGRVSWCNYIKYSFFADFVVEVNMTILNGDVGGIVFRGVGNAGYFLSIDTTGRLRLTRYDSSGSHGTILVNLGNASPAFHAGQNTIAVAARGSQMDWYINSQLVGSASDTTWSSGTIGLATGTYNDSGKSSSEAAYTSIRIWSLGQ